MARLLRALRKSSAPEIPSIMSSIPVPRRSPAQRDLSPSFSRMQRPEPDVDPVMFILQTLLYNIDQEEAEVDTTDDEMESDISFDDDSVQEHFAQEVIEVSVISLLAILWENAI